MTPTLLRDDALVSTPDGFALRLSLPWIRSLPLRCVTGLRVTIDGEDVPSAAALLDGRSVPLDELGDESGWWFLQDRLELRAEGRLTPGAHDVEVAVTLSVPYLQAAPDAPLTLPFRESRSLHLGDAGAAGQPLGASGSGPAHAEDRVAVEPAAGAPESAAAAGAALPAGWTLGVSTFNWTPEVLLAERPAHEIVVDVARRGIAQTMELEAGQVWRSFPVPSPAEVEALRDDLAASGASIAVVGLNLDEWSSPTRRRSEQERYDFLVPQIEAAHQVGATGVRLPIGQAGPDLQRRLLPLLHDRGLTLFEEVQGQQTPPSPAHREACEAIVDLNDPRLRFVVDISILMPALPESYLVELEAGGVPAELIARLRDEWRDPATHDAVVGLLRSGGVPPAVHTLYMDLLIRFGRSEVGDLAEILPFTGAVHLKFWDLDDESERVSRPIRELAGALAATGFTGTLASEWGGHEWLDDDPTEITRGHLALARSALSSGAAVSGRVS
ncbi:DUF6379 domain-containing protein [Herbiconiux sp. UC225_62]|uniref:C-glycoside deglycosidase beta subunit domain-containing protein n=1 Tax=Herbiconiux sp. UC225_62 TaxID=3350168 RepID=UPI0036D3F1CD